MYVCMYIIIDVSQIRIINHPWITIKNTIPPGPQRHGGQHQLRRDGSEHGRGLAVGRWRKTRGKPWGNPLGPWETMGKPWENPRKTILNHMKTRKTMGKPIEKP